MHPIRPVSVLVAPLDWGLGHATRCIPVIRELTKQGARVSIACSDPQKSLLLSEFPELDFYELPGYEIRYRQGVLLKWDLFFRFPFIRKRIKRENRWLNEFLQKHSIDAVISDNRFGFFHPDPVCVFLTHQLSVQSGMGSFVDRILLKWNYHWIRKFSCCWIPDWPGKISLGGRLSHPTIMPPIPIAYMGLLSRLKTIPADIKKDTILIMLSGPEPQRSQFEQIVLSQLDDPDIKYTLIRGLPGTSRSLDAKPWVKIFNHLPSEELNALMSLSEIIISRGGYSSIMDLVRIQRNAVIVPTTGQTEQEYLASHMREMNWMLTVRQKDFDLKETIERFRKTKLTLPPLPDSTLENTVKALLDECYRRRKQYAK
jgi:UDP:flavonoid glycosyltransferase YjiC (YdhE family)